ncbi:rhamnulokinase family protein [Acidothermaceae bacterium B102]|nr:rhamnulokinase family protein [Acidothermaceae bacterium B102]
MTDPAFVAVDLGASSGRVVVGQVGSGTVELTEVNRFANLPVRVGGTLHWDILGLYRGVLDGLRAAGRGFGPVSSVGIDSWAVDYGLLDADGVLTGMPVHYRDGRTDGVMPRVLADLPASELYAITGIQLLQINTIFQLAAARQAAGFSVARTLLLLPDLLTYWLTGAVGAEATNASTTALYDVTAGDWSYDLIERLGLSRQLFPQIHAPGSRTGLLRDEVLAETGLTGPVPVTAVGTHDTASAIVAVPASGSDFAYISCGTWSLVGVELDHPVLTEEARAANFTNEVGVDGTIRFLKNVMGLWLLQECVRTWTEQGLPADLATLLDEAARATPFGALIDPDSPEFLAPGDMPRRIHHYCVATGQTPPSGQGETVRCVLDSLALTYRARVREAADLSGKAVGVVHLVGGGARNTLLCQLTADACGLPVLAGPVEAAALGNILVQARALGVAQGGLAELRALSAASSEIRRYEPASDPATWTRAAARLDSLRH